MKKILLFLCLLWVGLACSDRSAPQKALEQAESYLSIHTDSARVYLAAIRHPNKLPLREQGIYAYIDAVIRDRKETIRYTDSLFLHAAQLSEEAGDIPYTVKALFQAARVNNITNRHAVADSLLTKALAIATEEADRPLLLEYAGYVKLSLDEPQKALDLHLRLLADTTGFSKQRQIRALSALAQSYRYTGQPDSAVSYYQQAIRLATETGRPEYTPYYYYRISDIYKEKGKTQPALAALKTAMETDNRQGVAYNLLARAMVFLATQENDSAKVYLQKALQSEDMFVATRASEYLASLSEGENNPEKALATWQNRKLLQDQVTNEVSHDIMRRQFEAEKLRNENNELKLKKKEQDIYLLLLCLAVALIAAGGIIFYMRERRRRMFRELKLKEWELRDQIARLEHEREVGTLNERATVMREQLFRQMSASEKIPSLSGRKGRRKKQDEAKEEEEHELRRLTNDEIEDVVTMVNNVAWSGFADRLKDTFPELKKSEIQFCCLIRAGVTVTELAAIYSITQSAICQRKVRIKRNKMNLHNDRRVLDDVLKDFDNEPPTAPTS